MVPLAAVVAVFLSLFTMAASPAQAGSAPGWLTSKPSVQQKAIEDAIAGLVRDDYVPNVAANSGGSYFPERTGEALRDAIRRVPTTAARNELLQTATTQAATKTGLWPRLMETALGVARTRGFLLATRAVPVLGLGAFVLWEVGNRKVEIRVTGHVVDASAVRFVGTGVGGACASFSVASADGAGGACPAGSRNMWWGQVTGRDPFLPPRSLQVQVWDSQANVWRGGTRCVSRITGDLQGTDSIGPLSTGGGTACNPLVPPNRDDYGYSYGENGDSVINGWQSLDPQQSCFGQTPCRKYTFSEGFGAWFTDPDTAGAALRAPSDLLPPGWSDGDPATVTSTLPPAVPHASLTGPLGQYLEGASPQAEAMREQMDHGLTEAGDPNDAKWQSPSTPAPAISDQGPTYGSFAMPNCRGLTEAVCRATLSSAGHTGSVSSSVLGYSLADLDLPAGAVVTTTPLPSTIVNPDAAVALRVNPDPLPVEVLAPAAHETFDGYRDRLRASGFLGDINQHTLTFDAADPDRGPDEVVRPSPQPGTRVDPTTAVSVSTNPPDMPPVDGSVGGTGGGGCDRPPIRPFEFGPVQPITHQFPFGIPFFILSWLDGLGGGGAAPAFDLDTPAGTIHVSMAWLSFVWSIVRPVILACAAVGMLVSLVNLLGRFWIDRDMAARSEP